MATIERFEGDFAHVRMQDGSVQVMPNALLPTDARVGSAVPMSEPLIAEDALLVGRMASSMDDAAARVQVPAATPPTQKDEPATPVADDGGVRDRVESLLVAKMAEIRERRPRVTLPPPTELTALGLFRMAALSRVRKARARRAAEGDE